GIDYKSLKTKDKKNLSKANLKNSEDTNILLTVARLTIGKGFKTMLVTYDKLIKDSNKKYHWFIAGDGDFKVDFEDTIKSLGLEKNITLLGRLTTEELVPYYKGADCFWLLSPDETFGLVYLEASYFNLGSIGYCKTGVKEAITEGVNGYYYEPFDDLELLVEKCKSLKKLRKPMTICNKYQISTFVNNILD
ncbi:glycosyltransferase family 4 protein, partial [Photobacterium sp. BZF1]|uniref:glycosyltransferase n=1 Tax=Photobacterium sp. BZF1 TaxID=1904457 RepID=UPI0016538094